MKRLVTIILIVLSFTLFSFSSMINLGAFPSFQPELVMLTIGIFIILVNMWIYAIIYIIYKTNIYKSIKSEEDKNK